MGRFADFDQHLRSLRDRLDRVWLKDGPPEPIDRSETEGQVESGCKLSRIVPGLAGHLLDRTVFGDSAELDRRIRGKKDSFDSVLARFRQRSESTTYYIGISRYNLYKLDHILDFFVSAKRVSLHPEAYAFNPRPFATIERRFFAYLSGLIDRAKPLGIEFRLYDASIPDLLHAFTKLDCSERELARLFGIIVEHAFIGPQTIVIDPHHFCNASCEHCWIHTPDVSHKKEFLTRKFDWEIYKNLIDDCRTMDVDGIIFQGDGEPLAYKRFLDMLRYARDREINVSFFSNGILLDEKVARSVIEYQVAEIFASVPAGTERTWGKINTKCDPKLFPIIIQNLKRLTELKNRQGSGKPKLQCTHVIHTQNYREVMAMACNDTLIGADLSRFYLIRLDENLRYLMLKDDEVEFLRTEIPKIKKFLKSTIHTVMVDNIEFQLGNYGSDDGSWASDTFLKTGCTVGWYFCLIPAKLDLSLCCHLRTIGYLDKMSFKDLWFSDHYQRIRFQAKYLRKYRNVSLLNGVKLYDEHCTHCDNHQQILKTHAYLNSFELMKFV